MRTSANVSIVCSVGILRSFLTHPAFCSMQYLQVARPAECLYNLDNASGLAWVTWPTDVSK